MRQGVPLLERNKVVQQNKYKSHRRIGAPPPPDASYTKLDTPPRSRCYCSPCSAAGRDEFSGARIEEAQNTETICELNRCMFHFPNFTHKDFPNQKNDDSVLPRCLYPTPKRKITQTKSTEQKADSDRSLGNSVFPPKEKTEWKLSKKLQQELNEDPTATKLYVPCSACKRYKHLLKVFIVSWCTDNCCNLESYVCSCDGSTRCTDHCGYCLFGNTITDCRCICDDCQTPVKICSCVRN